MSRLDPTLDLVFKLLLTREPALLLDMLRGILQRPLFDVTILDRDIPGALARDKSSILDIRTLLDDGSRADVEMHVLQLGSLSSPPTNGYAATVHRWARFFAARDDHELDRLASENSIMALATQTLDALSQDPETYRLARERADALKLYEIDLAAREAKGRAAGEAKGKAQLLRKQLELRFGPLSETLRARVETAPSEQLDEWAEQVLTATSLDEIFVP